MNSKQLKVLETGLFIFGIVGVVATAISAGRDTLKAEKVLLTTIDPLDGSTIDDVGNTVVVNKPVYCKEVVKTTWKCYIPTFVITTLTISAFIASKKLTAKEIAALSTAVAGAGSLVTKYRNQIREISGEDILHEIDRKVAADEITKARPPVISTSGLLSCEEMDLSEDGEYLFFDPFTKVKFTSTKLAVLGAKYYLNRNFSLGSEVPLSMFYAFLGLDLPEEYAYAGWDVSQMADDGYYWIDIDIVRSTEPDPETGKLYYILEYDFLPGDVEDNYYPFGNPLSQEGSFAC